MRVPLGVVGLPNIQIKRSFWLYVITLFLALIPTIMLRELVTNLVETVTNQTLAALVMYFLGYIISFSVFIVLYEGLKTGKFKLTWERIWCMFMAWLKSMTIILPAALMFAIVLIDSTLIRFWLLFSQRDEQEFNLCFNQLTNTRHPKPLGVTILLRYNGIEPVAEIIHQEEPGLV